MNTPKIVKYPATHIVHWPSGPVYACKTHAEKLVSFGRFMGTHVMATPADPGHECKNCVNEKAEEEE